MNAGSIYVLQQSDFLTGELSDQVKIGIVKDPRIPTDRLKEHQTGNSRKVAVASEYRALDVSAAEALTHRRLSTMRVFGEWFVSDSSDLSASFVQEIRLAVCETNTLANLQLEVEPLKASKSNGKARKATDGELEMAAEFGEYERIIRNYELEQSKIRTELASNSHGFAGIQDVSEWTFQEGLVGFSMPELKKIDPRVHAELMQGAIKGSFLPSVSRGKPIPKIVYPLNIAKLVGEGSLAERTEKHAEQHLRYLELEELICQFETTRDEIRLHLMLAVGLHDAIEDVATWKRRITDAPASGHAQFLKETRPDLFDKAQRRSSDRSGLRIKPYRSYPRD